MEKKIHKRCFISGCSGKSDKENTHVGVFSVPKASLAIWQEIIPKGGLTATSKICSRHFEEADIEKGRVIQDKFYPYARWTLKPGAVPKFFLGPSVSHASSLSNKKDIPLKCSSTKTVTKDSPIVLPRLLPKRTTDIPCDRIGDPNSNLSVHGPVTHYILVHESPLIFQNSNVATQLIQNDPSLNTFGGLPSTSSIHLAQIDDTSAASSIPSHSDHDYVVETVRSNVPAKKGNPEIVASQVEESRSVSSSAVHDCDHSYGIRPSCSAPTVEESCLDLDAVGYRDFISGVSFPSAEWYWSFNERTKLLICSCHYLSHDGVMTIKTVRIITKTKVELFLNGKSIQPPYIKLEFHKKTELSKILEDFHIRKTCLGIVEESLKDVEVTDKYAAFKDRNVWRSKECLGLANTRLLCLKCQMLRRNLRRMIKNPIKSKDFKKYYRRKLDTSQRALQRMKQKAEKYSATIDELRKERQKLIWNAFDARIKILNPKEQLVVKTMMAKAKVTPGRNDRFTAMRYDPEFLADCLLIKRKSSAVYKHLRSNGILPLPSLSTLLRLAKKSNLGSLNSEVTGAVHDSDEPIQHTLDQSDSTPDSDQLTSKNLWEETMENGCSESTDFTVAMSPEIVLPEAEEIIVEIYSAE
ncbi:uncharacterized protein LOC130687415 [Daphnia carinata]|uniref:uncharacterized protein LOC130687415 n=1 Tax=Daphnia carinata TaxID=120202 RepID=UPI00257FC0D7|nr:uncharacterized protein LOC130687415 [Daphnia carinata]XP_059351037.1 uncharacterized protein LOC130687415 [Daphnia carinata]